jgi:hypothetical protein
MRDVHQIAIQGLQQRPAFEVSGNRSIVLAESLALKVLRQRSDFGYFLRRSQEPVFVVMIKPCERANNIASVSSDAKVGHAADIDGDSHEIILITPG